LPDPDRVVEPEDHPPVFEEIRALLRIRSLRALTLGAGIATGGVSGLGFWAPSFFERHGGLTGGAGAAVTGGLILFGALAGIGLGARWSDRLRLTNPGGAMWQGGVTQMLAAAVLFVAFLDVPTWLVRVPLFAIGIPLIVNALPGLSATTAEIVPTELRGMAYSVTALVSTAIAAVSAPLIGLLADQFPYETVTDGVATTEGNLAIAFRIVVPFMAVGGLLVYRGSRAVEADIADFGNSPLPN
jgi:hypothetical protein